MLADDTVEVWHVFLDVGAATMGKNVGGGVNGVMTLWWWETESGSGHHEEEESSKLVPGDEKKVVLCIDYRLEKYIRPSKEAREEFYEIEAEKLADLIKKNGRKVDRLPKRD